MRWHVKPVEGGEWSVEREVEPGKVEQWVVLPEDRETHAKDLAYLLNSQEEATK